MACAAFLCGFLYLLDSLVLHWQPGAHELLPRIREFQPSRTHIPQDFHPVAIMRFFPTPTGSEPADPIAKGIIPTARQSLSDLLKWKQRTVVVNDFGETSCEWQDPEPLTNPITLFMQLKARDVSRQPSIPPGSERSMLTVSVALFHLRISRLDSRCLRFPCPLDPDSQTGCLLQAIQHKYLNGHHSHSASPLCGCCILWSCGR